MNHDTKPHFRYASQHDNIGAIGLAVNYPNWNNLSIISSGTTSSKESEDFTPKVLALFTHDGNVGIGTSDPKSTLEVNGDIKAHDIRFGSGGWLGSGGAGIELGDSLQAGVTPYIDFHYGTGSQQDYNMRIINNADKKLTIQGGDLAVTGDVKATNFNGSLVSEKGVGALVVTDMGQLICFMPVVGPVWSSDGTLSDIMMKKDLRSLENSLEKLQSLRGTLFSWKEDAFGEGRQIGVIAQEVEKVFPELVSAIDGRKFVNYQGLIPVLIEAVKEQQVLISQLREEVRGYGVR
ncbi:MAG: tail fiber domain-containing protein [Candidatus Accumulibacter phosphatis]|nr:tail fiber domain-containing protein [Candidatus Accumulibacter phosphatis]